MIPALSQLVIYTELRNIGTIRIVFAKTLLRNRRRATVISMGWPQTQAISPGSCETADKMDSRKSAHGRSTAHAFCSGIVNVSSPDHEHQTSGQCRHEFHTAARLAGIGGHLFSAMLDLPASAGSMAPRPDLQRLPSHVPELEQEAADTHEPGYGTRPCRVPEEKSHDHVCAQGDPHIRRYILTFCGGCVQVLRP